jgi:hypothetical protein
MPHDEFYELVLSIFSAWKLQKDDLGGGGGGEKKVKRHAIQVNRQSQTQSS